MSPVAVVAGGQGSGKTTLIRRFLESNKSRIVAASRCRAVAGSGDWTETLLPASPSGHSRVPHFDELRQYEAAGADFVEHFHAERNHQGVGNQLIEPGEEAARTSGEVVCRERLGGLLRYYYREAA